MLVSINDVKDSLPDIYIDTAKTTLLQSLISDVEKIFEKYCFRKFVYANYLEKHSGEYGKNKIILRGYPLWSISSISIDEIEANSSDYEWESNLSIVYSPLFSSPGFNNIVINYIAGWKDAGTKEKEADEDFKRAIIDEVVLRYTNYQEANRTGERLVDLKSEFLSPKVKEILNRYKIPKW